MITLDLPCNTSLLREQRNRTPVNAPEALVARTLIPLVQQLGADVDHNTRRKQGFFPGEMPLAHAF